MKKVALMIAAVLILCCVPALSEGDGEPILFRGIEWGSSYADISETVELKSLQSNTSGISPTYIRRRTGDDNAYPDGYKFTGFAQYADSEIAAIGEIAGYGLYDICLYFVYIPEDGEFIRDEEHAALYCACYKLHNAPSDPEMRHIDSEEDLIAKLSALYGDYEKELTGSERCYVWHGAQGTLVSLLCRPAWAPQITYSYEGGEELLRRAQETQDAINAAINAKESEFRQNTNGL